MISAATTLTPPRTRATTFSKSPLPPRATAPSPTPSSTNAQRGPARKRAALAGCSRAQLAAELQDDAACQLLTDARRPREGRRVAGGDGVGEVVGRHDG